MVFLYGFVLFLTVDHEYACYPMNMESYFVNSEVATGVHGKALYH